MKAVESFACTGVLPTARVHSVTAFTAASSVRIVRTTSTSFMSGTGLKKCTPRTCPGRLLAAAIAVPLHDYGRGHPGAGAGARRALIQSVAAHSDRLEVHSSELPS